jgi:hypothetical protein
VLKNHSPIFPALFQGNTIPQFIEAQQPSGFLQSNFEENAVSGFDEFKLGLNEQIRSTETWNTEDQVSTARSGFRTNQQDDHGRIRNHPQNQQLKFPTFLTKREKSTN